MRNSNATAQRSPRWVQTFNLLWLVYYCHYYLLCMTGDLTRTIVCRYINTALYVPKFLSQLPAGYLQANIRCSFQSPTNQRICLNPKLPTVPKKGCLPCTINPSSNAKPKWCWIIWLKLRQNYNFTIGEDLPDILNECSGADIILGEKASERKL